MTPPAYSPHFLWRPKHTAPTQGQPLSGMKLAVKDVFDIEGLQTTCGNPRWAQTHGPATATAPVVQALLNAGAHLVGKTLTDELAYSLNGINYHYGTPVNPAAPDRLPGGSSSGSAVAVGLQQADIGLGTDTGGSIRVPAAYNGLYGLRPTHNTVTTEHLIGLAPAFDTVGWLTRDIQTLEAVANVLLPAEKPMTEFAHIVAPAALWRHCSYQSKANQLFDTCLHPIVIAHDWAFDANLSELSLAFRTLQGKEILKTHGQWLSQHDDALANDIRARVDWCRTLSTEEISAATLIQARFRQQIALCLKQDTIWVIPTTPGPAPLLNMQADHLTHYREILMGFTALASLAGFPQLHIPLFTAEGAPCGLSLLGNAHSEFQLIHFAYTLLESLNR